jgi:HPt (histidine-containing phosphotransfer) domain-containing protein
MVKIRQYIRDLSKIKNNFSHRHVFKGAAKMSKNKVYIDSDLEFLIPQFLENREEDIKKLEKLLKKSEFDQIRIIGHSLKGSGGGYGFDYLTEIGNQIEQEAELKNENKIENLISELKNYLNNIEIIYEDQ